MRRKKVINFKIYRILICSLLFLTNQLYSQSISDVRYYLEPVIYETEYEVFDKMFNITIQSGRTQVNVRNT